MPRNVEIKCRVKDLAKVRELSRLLASQDGNPNSSEQTLLQRDVFFKVPQGRLKLREFSPAPNQTDPVKPSQLIFYQRSDQTGPKLSDYSISRFPLEVAKEIKQTLTMALGVVGEVRKTRFLYLVGQTRIHCDSVDGLGEFAELEVVLEDDQSQEYGVDIAKDIMKKLELDEKELISGAYMDLILAKNQN